MKVQTQVYLLFALLIVAGVVAFLGYQKSAGLEKKANALLLYLNEQVTKGKLAVASPQLQEGFRKAGLIP